MVSLGSTRRERSRSRREIKNLMQKFDAQMTDISLYLTLLERQAREAGIEEQEWVPHLISLLLLELAQIIIKEPEEKMRDYVSIKEVLLNRFKMKPETFRLKFTQHQKKPGALWKEMVFELRNYLEGWLDGLEVKDLKSLKDLMIVDQLKRRVSSDIKDHFLEEWGNLVDPLELSGKLDQYESVMNSRKTNHVRMPERKPIEKVRPSSPKKDNASKSAEKSEQQIWKNSTPKERFYRATKRILKVLCLESGNDWEKNLLATLLVLRTITQETTGFSPAELVHRKNLRTPEALLYEDWFKPQEADSTVSEYVFELINRMRCQELAVEKMTEVQAKRKVWYDKNVKA
ncbi:hypothetical protein AVEN_143719-1 [Araneus ventricosus]|uniref:Uncharacterized protein n=1 Tax=Araneus ventricosus TaxID=182803 RepID=A0A4Y2ANQ9_ARAVE|nr:hypothetical protein AVEN_143719-1 [Araneus ventricosus]